MGNGSVLGPNAFSVRCEERIEGRSCVDGLERRRSGGTRMSVGGVPRDGACHEVERVTRWSVSRGGVCHDMRDLACPGVRTARQAETASHSQPAMKQLPPMGVRMPSGRVPVSTSR